ncbi:hypothetical protein BU23DRAFT_590354 [Bimuria novae-zelandiae CBS 107.79]|uniref:NmrA-like domain-containing protein n=1 Tax=Bimuria novae-zelandiae CBS 107.79 TaxID=1447943 RepID=A0A6A5V4J5_9PLEO|nr:hypothetical protein BU23DRAFT_590354 [Bimuria novae-zelandiae CBS 107.79]
MLIGANGLLGGPVLQAFLNSNAFNVTAAMRGQDAVISMVPGNLSGSQITLIDAAIAAGVQRFIPSEFGPNTRNPKVVDVVPSLPAKVQVAEYLMSKESSMSWSILITMNFDLSAKSVTFVDGGGNPVTMTTLPKTGKAGVAMLQHKEETKNQYVFVHSFHTSQKEVLTAIENVDYPHKWRVEYQTAQEVLDTGYRKLEKGDFTGNFHLVAGDAGG